MQVALFLVNTLSAPGDPLEGIEGIGDSGGRIAQRNRIGCHPGTLLNATAGTARHGPPTLPGDGRAGDRRRSSGTFSDRRGRTARPGCMRMQVRMVADRAWRASAQPSGRTACGGPGKHTRR